MRNLFLARVISVAAMIAGSGLCGIVSAEDQPPIGGDTGQKPDIVIEQKGNITNLRVEGDLAPTQPVGCIQVSDAKNTLTPADLYAGVAECISLKKYDQAARLFALAGIFARFDSERVTDVSAKQAGAVLIMNTFSPLSDDQKQAFQDAVKKVTGGKNALKVLCTDVQKIGMPDYYPKYMVLHGMKAFTGDPNEGALRADFDPKATWKTLLSAYLHCRP